MRSGSRRAAEFSPSYRPSDCHAGNSAVESCVVQGRHEIPPLSGVNHVGFCDGSSDSMTLGIAHDERGTAVLDVVRECVPPFSPENVVREFAALLRSYRIHAVTGDHYAGEWPREQFSKHGIAMK